MIVQKIAHCTDSILTQEMARIGLEAVSYTHLDVYKRQLIFREL